MRKLVVSFPKSGRTWLRYGLHLAGHPDIAFTHDGFEYNDGTLPPLDFDPKARRLAYKDIDKIVYVQRDPRDTVVSLFHQITGRFDDFFQYRGNISDFIRDPYFGIQNIVGFQNMWHKLSSDLPVLTVNYEQMSSDYGQVLTRVLRHFELEADAGTISKIAKQTSFDEMKEVEQSESFGEPWLRPRLNAPKVRKGQVSGYLEELSADDIRYVDDAIESLSLRSANL